VIAANPELQRARSAEGPSVSPRQWPARSTGAGVPGLDLVAWPRELGALAWKIAYERLERHSQRRRLQRKSRGGALGEVASSQWLVLTRTASSTQISGDRTHLQPGILHQALPRRGQPGPSRPGPPVRNPARSPTFTGKKFIVEKLEEYKHSVHRYGNGPYTRGR